MKLRKVIYQKVSDDVIIPIIETYDTEKITKSQELEDCTISKLFQNDMITILTE